MSTTTQVKATSQKPSGSAPKKAQHPGGGARAGNWVDRYVPESWQPYIQLARVNPPLAVLLIYFPHVFGAIYGGIVTRAPPEQTLKVLAILLGGSFFFSNAAHAWDDWADVPIDKLIPRTQKRPIVRGAISPNAALVFCAAQGALAAAFLLPLPPATALYAVGTIIGTLYYPFAKRHIACPQVVLGYTLANAIAVGAAAIGADPLETSAVPLMILASALWSVIYDTIYGSIDMQDDVRLGVGNTAVLFGSAIKPWLSLFLVILVAALGAAGQVAGFGTAYHVISMLGAGLPIGAMIRYVKLQDAYSCWWWFTNAFNFVGVSVTIALLTEYVPLVLEG